MYNWEKKGWGFGSENQMKQFRDAIDKVEYKDLGYTRAPFALCNGRQGEQRVWERLDRVLINEA